MFPSDYSGTVVDVTRRFEFDYAHRVLWHQGKCANLHGHRGVAEVTVSSPELDPMGMVVDFAVLKDKVGGWIDEFWDHNLLLHYLDPLAEYVPSITGHLPGKKPFIFDRELGNPTAENMAKQIRWQVATAIRCSWR